MNVRVPVTDVAQVAFEMAYVHRIKADLKRSKGLEQDVCVQDRTYGGDE